MDKYLTTFDKIQLLKMFLLSNKKGTDFYIESGVCYNTFLQYIRHAKGYLYFKTNIRDYWAGEFKGKHFYLTAINSLEEKDSGNSISHCTNIGYNFYNK